MATKSLTSRSDWIEAGFEMLGTRGPDGVSVDRIAEQLGVSRAGFYHRFRDRAELLDAIVDHWFAYGRGIYAQADQLPDARERIRTGLTLALTDLPFRRAEAWLLLHTPSQPGLDRRTTEVRDELVTWAGELLTELGIAGERVPRRAHLLYLGYLGLVGDLASRTQEPSPDEIGRSIDTLVEAVVAS